DVPIRLEDPTVIERRRHGSQRPNRGAQPSGSPPGEPTLGSILVSRARANTKDRPDAQVCVAARYALMAALAPLSRGPLFESVSAACLCRPSGDSAGERVRPDSRNLCLKAAGA